MNIEQLLLDPDPIGLSSVIYIALRIGTPASCKSTKESREPGGLQVSSNKILDTFRALGRRFHVRR